MANHSYVMWEHFCPRGVSLDGSPMGGLGHFAQIAFLFSSPHLFPATSTTWMSGIERSGECVVLNFAEALGLQVLGLPRSPVERLQDT